MNLTTLAFLGDAFFELLVRRRLAERGGAGADRLHLAAVRYVNASSQAKAMRNLAAGENILSAEELDLVRRARNRKPKSVPRNTDPVDYKLATAFEALLGYHYMGGRPERAEVLAELAINILDNNK